MNRLSQRLRDLSPEQRKLLEMRLKKEGIDISKHRKRFFSIPCVEKRQYYALSSAQKSLYVLQQMKIESTGYNVPDLITLQGKPDKEELGKTLKKLTQRHESLRTSFAIVNDEPAQVIHNNVDFNVEYCELNRSEGNIKGEEIIKDFIKPFDLSKAPLFRVRLIETGGTTHILLFDIHHIITDNTSRFLLREDFISLAEGKEQSPLRLQYKDFAVWQNSIEHKELRKEQESYWLKLFSGKLPVLTLPTDFPRPEIRDFEGASLDVLLSKEETGILRRISRENNATLFMTFLAVFNVLLSKLSGQEDIIVGTPVTSRCCIELDRVAGMVINTLPMRHYPSGEKSFEEFLKEVKQQTIKAFENQDYQFEDLVSQIAVERDTGRNPIFDVLLSLTSKYESGEHTSIIEKKHDTVVSIRVVSKFDLILDIVERVEDIMVIFRYSVNLFKPATIKKFIRCFRRIVYELSCYVGKRIGDIEVLTLEDKREIVESIRNRNNKVFADTKRKVKNEIKNPEVGFNF